MAKYSTCEVLWALESYGVKYSMNNFSYHQMWLELFFTLDSKLRRYARVSKYMQNETSYDGSWGTIYCSKSSQLGKFHGLQQSVLESECPSFHLRLCELLLLQSQTKRLVRYAIWKLVWAFVTNGVFLFRNQSQLLLLFSLPFTKLGDGYCDLSRPFRQANIQSSKAGFISGIGLLI